MKMRRRALGLLVLLWGCAGEDIAAPLDHVGEFAKAGGFPVVIVRSGPAPGAGVPVPVPIFENFVDAIDAVAPGGTIRVIPGSHLVEGVVIDKPVTIQGLGNGTALIRNETGLFSFGVSAVASGTVAFRGLTFLNTSPQDLPGLVTYSIRPEGDYDQVVIDGSSFTTTDGTGGIRNGASAVEGARVIVQNSSFTGGFLGVLSSAARLEVLGSSFSNLSNRAVDYRLGATGRIESSTFTECGSFQCIVAFSDGTNVEVVGNQFTRSVLSGNSVPDLNHHIAFRAGTTGRIEDNDFTGCEFFGCINVRGQNVATVGNRLTHVAGRPQQDVHSMIRYENGSTGLIENNGLDGCAFSCIEVNFGSNVAVKRNVMTAYDEHGTQFGIVGFGGFASDVPIPPTLIIDGNTIVGIGGTAATDPTNLSAYAIDQAGILIQNATATVFRNSVSNAQRGFFAVDGGTITDGSDNVVDQVLTGVASFNQSAVTIHSSDFTNYHFSIDGDFAPVSLTCNWWGTTLGPQNTNVPTGVFTPWALVPVAGSSITTCMGGLEP